MNGISIKGIFDAILQRLLNQCLFYYKIRDNITKLTDISKWLKEEREIALYGDDDIISTEYYTKDQAQRAFIESSFVIEMAEK